MFTEADDLKALKTQVLTKSFKTSGCELPKKVVYDSQSKKKEKNLNSLIFFNFYCFAQEGWAIGYIFSLIRTFITFFCSEGVAVTRFFLKVDLILDA